jgi:hypothetical protein
MRRLAALLLLAGCARPAPGPTPEREYQRVGPLELSAYVERDLGDVLATVDVMNTGRETVRLEYAGQCGLAVILHDAERQRWDSSAWWSAQGECPAATTTLDLPPRTLGRIIAPLLEARAILGDSLPLRSYRAVMRFRLVQPTDTTLLLPAGELDLDPTGTPSLAAGRRRAYP